MTDILSIYKNDDDEEVEISPLSSKENKRRADLETVIERNFTGFVAVGSALAEIREKRLYRSTHRTFEGYCKDLWEMNIRHAQRYIASTEVIKNLKNATHGSQNESEKSDIPLIPESLLPKNERQARPLTRLEPDQQLDVWRHVIAHAPNGRITAALVARTVSEYVGAEVVQRLGSTKTRIARETVISDDFKSGLQSLLNAVSDARAQKWKTTSREAAVLCLDEAKAAILREA